MLTELSVVEQRYLAVREALDGAKITDVATRYGVDRRTIHRWLVRYANEGLGALADRTSRPEMSCSGCEGSAPLSQSVSCFGVRVRYLCPTMAPLIADRELQQNLLGLGRDLWGPGGRRRARGPARPSRRGDRAQGRELP